LWFDVSADQIRSLFLQIQLSESLKAADPAYLVKFIDAQLKNGELTSWRVAVMSKSKTVIRHTIERVGNSLNVGCYVRNQDPLINGNTYFLRKSHIISPMDEVIDLTSEELKRAKARTEDLWKSKGKKGTPSYPSGEIVRNEIRSPQNPLLIIYYLEPSGANLPFECD